MKPIRNLGWILLALLPRAAAIAATPAGPAVPHPDPAVAALDREMESLVNAVWQYSTQGDDDQRRRELVADLDRYVMSDETLKELQDLRAGIPAQLGPGEDRIPAATIDPLKRVVQREGCKLEAILSHWTQSPSGVIRTDMDEALGRLPAARREPLEREIEAIFARLRPTREQMETQVRECASLQLARSTATAERIGMVVMDLVPMRGKLAAAVNEAVQAGEIGIIRHARTSPCPAPRPPTPGEARPQLARQGDANYYPEVARRLLIEGSIRVRVEIDTGGCVAGVSIVETSASEMLDQAAIRRAMDMEFIPAEVDGKPAEYGALQRMIFSLK